MIRARAAVEKSIRAVVSITPWPGPMISCGANCDGWMITSRTRSSSTPSVSMATRALKWHGKPMPGDLDAFDLDSPHNQAFFPWYLYNWRADAAEGEDAGSDTPTIAESYLERRQAGVRWSAV